MTCRIQLTLPYDKDLGPSLDREVPGWVDYRIIAQSLDARGANRGKKPSFQYTVEVIKNGEKFTPFEGEFPSLEWRGEKPLVIGAGPAGLFCALRFAEYGIPVTLIERGEQSQKRMRSIARYWRYGVINKDSNVCFGEGGAGLYSDGKLITRVKSPHVPWVMKKFVDFGAPADTAWVSNPHLGSNKIRTLIGAITEYLREKGCDIRFETRVEELLFDEEKVCGARLQNGESIKSEHVILATGHSAHDIYRHLRANKVAMGSKDFAVGVRVEHPRRFIDEIQYGAFSTDDRLETARYRLSWHDHTVERGCYSFCMCPGGHVLSSGTDEDGIVTNGMSNFARNSPWSNSAVVVSVKKGKDFDGDDPMAGLVFQREMEKVAFTKSKEKATGREIPSQRIRDFIEGKKSKDLPKSSCPSGLFSQDLNHMLPDFVSAQLRTALERFDRSMPGFATSDKGLMLAPETRTSAPITIERDKNTLESVSHKGLFPCGEGAGYAGGITSAAVDGVRVAEQVVARVFPSCAKHNW